MRALLSVSGPGQGFGWRASETGPQIGRKGQVLPHLRHGNYHQLTKDIQQIGLQGPSGVQVLWLRKGQQRPAFSQRHPPAPILPNCLTGALNKVQIKVFSINDFFDA